MPFDKKELTLDIYKEKTSELQDIQTACARGEHYYKESYGIKEKRYLFMSSNVNDSNDAMTEDSLKNAIYQFLSSNLFLIEADYSMLNRSIVETSSEKKDRNARVYFTTANYNSLYSLRKGMEDTVVTYQDLVFKFFDYSDNILQGSFYLKMVFIMVLLLYLLIVTKKINNSNHNVMTMFAILSKKQLKVLIQKLYDFRRETLEEYFTIGSLDKKNIALEENERWMKEEEGSSSEGEEEEMSNIEAVEQEMGESDDDFDNISHIPGPSMLSSTVKRRNSDKRRSNSSQSNINDLIPDFNKNKKKLSVPPKSRNKPNFNKANLKINSSRKSKKSVVGRKKKFKRVDEMRRSNRLDEFGKQVSLRGVSISARENKRFSTSESKDEDLMRDRIERLGKVKVNYNSKIYKHLFFITMIYIIIAVSFNLLQISISSSKKFAFSLKNSLSLTQKNLKFSFNLMYESLASYESPKDAEGKQKV